jgi:hypothetical protein
MLEVDVVRVGNDMASSKRTCITKADIFAGCTQIWTLKLSSLNSFKVSINEWKGQMCADDSKGIDVTLTIEFGGSSLKFCSVVVYDSGLGSQS